MSEYVYCAVDSKNEIRAMKGSSTQTRYYKTDKHVQHAVKYYNKYNPEDKLRVGKFELVEVPYV